MTRTEREARDLLVERFRSTLDATGGAFPYYADPETGEWTTTANGNWCGGHWVGLLWLAHAITGEDRFDEAAREHAETVVEYMPRDAMFCGMNFNYAGFRAYDVTGEAPHRRVGVDGADATVEYFHEGARQVPLGLLEIESPAQEFRGPVTDEGPSGERLGAVDAVYTSTPVLWRAYRETGDPHYRDYAVSHADRALDWYVREDGRTWHHAEFDLETGDLVSQYNELAYSDDTCWARGQGWAIAGFSRCYRETGADRYLDALEQMVDYYTGHAPDDLIPHWDFEHPDKPDVPRDTSCAALSAYGLTRLPDEGETATLHAVGEQILDSLIQDYLTPRDDGSDRPDGMLLEGCYNGPSGWADRHELVWSEYYLLYALHRRVAADEAGEAGD